MACPDCPKTCHSLGSVQLCLMPSEQKQLTAKAAPFGRFARRCAHCGLVYLRAPMSHRLGWLDGVKGPGFHPAPEYS